MRPSLLPGLLAAAARNAARGAESDRACSRSAGAISSDGERPTLGLVLAGARAARHWRGGTARRLRRVRRQGRGAGDPRRRRRAGRQSPGAGRAPRRSIIPASRAGSASGPKNVLAEFGALHPRILKAFDLDGPVVAAEIFLDAIPQQARRRGHMRSAYAPPRAAGGDPRLRLPGPRRAARRPAAARRARRRQGGDRRREPVRRLHRPGRAGGPEIARGRSALQPGEKSFTDEELKAISDRIVAAAAKLGAVLRA